MIKGNLDLFNRGKLTDEKVQIAANLLPLIFLFLYQLLKSHLSVNYRVDSVEQWIRFNLLASLSFAAISVLLIVFTPKITHLSSKMAITLIIIGFSLALSVSFTFMFRGIDWKGNDVPKDSFALAKEVQRQGAIDFISTYNDRGNPGVPGSSSYANNVYDFLKSLGLEKMAYSHWIGNMDRSIRPLMHPPTFFIVLAGWQYIFGNTELSATAFMWISTAMWGLLCFTLLEAIQSKASVFLTLLFITLPTTIIDTWFPTYDVISAALLMIGFALFILGTAKKINSIYLFLSGLAFGASVMFRLTSLFLAILVPIALLYLIAKQLQPKSSIFLYLVGLLIFPATLFVIGYNPILTLVTAKFRQDAYYGESAFSLLNRLPNFLYLGIPLITLLGFGILRRFSELIKSVKGVWIILLLAATIFLAIITRLTSDFHRNMLGISACFVLAVSLLENWPQSRKYQALLIGINLSFVLMTTLF